jgi:hypothetical protein
MSAIIAGTVAPIPNPVETVWRKRGGSEFIHSWTGVAESVRAMEAALRASGSIEVSVTQQPGSALATIRAHYATEQTGEPEQINETLTIDFVDETFPINVHPAFVNIADDVIQYLEERAKDTTVTIDDSVADATGQYYMRLVRRSETSYRAALPVITYTRNVADTTDATLDAEDIGKIYSKEDVASFIAAPIIFAIPDANVGIAAGGHYQVGYRFFCQMEFDASGRINLIEKYTYGRYEEVLYGLESIS